MLAIWAKHTKIPLDSAETCDMCSNIQMFFWRPTLQKICG